jgi:hypothetical protein
VVAERSRGLGGVAALARRLLGDGRVMLTMSFGTDDSSWVARARRRDAILARLARVCEQVQLDGEAPARVAVAEMDALVAEAERLAWCELAEQARDALAEAWRWRRGEDAVDSRIRLARLARAMWKALAAGAGGPTN